MKNDKITTAQPWCGGHSTSISACGGKGPDSSFQKRDSHIYTLRLR